MPHGDDGSSVGVTTTHAVMDVSPAATAATTAPRSAQIVAPYEADSTLHPATIRPLPHSTAAPTWKDEYGARARDCAQSLAGVIAFIRRQPRVGGPRWQQRSRVLRAAIVGPTRRPARRVHSITSIFPPGRSL